MKPMGRHASDCGILLRAPSPGHTVIVIGIPNDDTIVRYGRGVPGDDELRLCGDLSGGHRALELGISDSYNALAFAAAGAKAIAVDPDNARINALRAHAAERELFVECHAGELADLGFATSGSIALVVADHTLEDVDDLGRLLRQVHRVLIPSHPFVIAMPHPFADVHDGDIVRPYGTGARTLGEWFTALGRANFRVDVMHELGVSDRRPIPTTLVLRARKEGS